MKRHFLIFILALVITGCKDNSVKKQDDTPTGVRVRKAESSKWISKVLEYKPAAGQFINTSIGDANAAQSIVGKKGTVSLGGFGGRIDFMFDHSILNQSGVDFVIHGNGFEGSSEPAIVMVSVDANNNGLADDVWYELKGSEYDKSTKNYSITYIKPSDTSKAVDVKWSDNGGKSGVVAANEFHNQCYYPLFTESNELTFVGSKLNDSAVLGSGGIWVLNGYQWGYADNASADYMEVVGDDKETGFSNKFDIDNAVDQNGNKVELKWVDFIRVYTAVNQQCGWVGEISSEVCGAISLTNVK